MTWLKAVWLTSCKQGRDLLFERAAQTPYQQHHAHRMIEAADRLRNADQRRDAVLQHAAQALHGLRRHEIEQDGFVDLDCAVNGIKVVHKVRL